MGSPSQPLPRGHRLRAGELSPGAGPEDASKHPSYLPPISAHVSTSH